MVCAHRVELFLFRAPQARSHALFHRDISQPVTARDEKGWVALFLFSPQKHFFSDWPGLLKRLHCTRCRSKKQHSVIMVLVHWFAIFRLELVKRTATHYSTAIWEPVTARDEQGWVALFSFFAKQNISDWPGLFD